MKPIAVIGLEWIAIGAILLIILLWGPGQLPKLARSIGLAKKEFDEAKRELEHPTKKTEDS